MHFKEKYTLDKAKEPQKQQISPESYAICELLEEIRNRLETGVKL